MWCHHIWHKNKPKDKRTCQNVPKFSRVPKSGKNRGCVNSRVSIPDKFGIYIYMHLVVNLKHTYSLLEVCLFY